MKSDSHDSISHRVRERTLNEVIDSMSVGRFHYMMLMVCGLAFTADAMEVSLLSFISTCAGHDWDLNDSQMASITSIVFAGELMGSMFWGPLADKYGRRLVLLLSCSIISIVGFCSGLSPNYVSLLLFRGVVGFGVGGLFVPFDILAEFMPVTQRGKFSLYISYFWTLGSLFVASVAWGLLSTRGWRVLAFITAVPVTLSSILSITLLPESPRWLVVQGRIKEAEEVLKWAAKINGTELGKFTLSDDVEREEIASVKELLKPQHIGVSIPLWVAWFSFGCCYYGVILFVTKVFEDNGGDDDDISCSFDYAAIFYSAASEVVGVFITIQVIDWWGRIPTQALSFCLAGIGIFCMGISMPFAPLVVVSVFARMTAVAANSAVWVSTPELFSTELRATGHSVANCMARIGAFLSPYVAESTSISHFVIGVIFAIINFIGMIAVYFLPETKGKDLDTAVEPRLRVSSVSFVTRHSVDYDVHGDTKNPMY
mmetsp:Transcript_1195/g.1945  ORF Transcript_1195/g.1945 Transcript_1195/m.1945 type:complete len:485 (+) Transcript_1195:25-1479(+)